MLCFTRIVFAFPRALTAFAAVLIIVTAWGFYEQEKGDLTDAAGRLSAARASSFMVMDVASHCGTASELIQRLGPAPVRVRRDWGYFVGYICRDGKAVVVRTDPGGVVIARPCFAPVVSQAGPRLLP